MSKIEKAVAWALDIAHDPAHGYSQENRWGPDYDCSSLVISAFEQAGVPVKTRGATYTGNMRAVFLSCGFADVTDAVDLSTGAGLVRGDVLLNELSHTALALGGGRIVQASGNERGGATGGIPGDQTGAEIHERGYYNSPWDCVLRYRDAVSGKSPAATEDVSVAELSIGALGEGVKAMQSLLALRGHPCGASGVDGDFGAATYSAVAAFQRERGLMPDGICGVKTWSALING